MFQIDTEVLQVKQQVRQPDAVFLKNLVTNMVEFADEAYQPLCVLVEDIESPGDFDKKKVNGYNYQVIGGQHCLLATKEIAKTMKYISDDRFKTRNCVVYAGLNSEQQRWLAVKHNSTGEYRHAITLKDKVEVCRRYRDEIPDKDKLKWKASCGLILTQKKGNQLLEVVCFLASLDDSTYKILEEIFQMHEEGALKKQKLKESSISKPDIPPYVFRTLRSLDSETVKSLLTDVRDRNTTISEFYKESQALYKISLVQKSFIQLMDLSSWDEVVEKYPSETTRENLVRFSSLSFRPTIPDVFVNYCQRLRIENSPVNQGETNAVFHGKNKTRSFVVEGSSMELDPEQLKKITGHLTGVDLVILDTPQDWRGKEIKSFFVTVKNVNVTARVSNYTMIVICEVDTIHVVKEQLKSAGYAKIDVAYTYIEDASSDTATLTNAIQPVVIGYWASDGKVKRNVLNIKEDSPISRHNFWRTQKPVLDKDGDGVIVNSQQKHVQFFKTLLDKFSYPNQWVLDACCGTGTAIVAAMACGRNCIGFDTDRRQVEHSIVKCDSIIIGEDEDMDMDLDD
ncbi:uncharacterized protein LOC100371633 [Saccoglossus kowalevskii]